MMKLSIAVLVATSFASCANKNADASLESAASSPIYKVEPMLCAGTIAKKPAGMNSDYEQILMKLVSFKSKRSDGVWVDSLEVSNAYFKRSETIDMDTDNFGEVWYMGPLSLKGKQVSRSNLSGRGDNLALKIVGTGSKDTLEGTYSLKGTVVGDYTYNMKCTANPVREPSRRDDNTKQ